MKCFPTDDLALLWQTWSRRKYPTYIFLALCLNVILASAAFAATGDTFTRPQIYALGILGLGTVALSGYLFVVMFQPERF
ncbi:potassium-transporting ATPase subunit F [Chamaesiphon minutus]|uniref:F subunit of K+-transporting ATPase (Potass_KdpF) n=1 Tax=Chamaesiphon minutus (strain ATCC 27169 / PCC 6605) TaxID=1173020 RepID=K9UEQ7_CHAP6|nr:potassium-transporting ATPase subunit F [Chamaesiphon minutus]AFY93285.1 F subunit of K+-transporting ATPase (Potass_KdpF) [Chamaesiphon minutus PCC 6605]